MALLIIVSLYGLSFSLLQFLISIEMSNELRLAVNVLGFIGALFIPIAIYSIIDLKLTRRAVNLVGRNWCEQNSAEFEEIEMYKNHFALIHFKSGKKVRQKFIIKFLPTTWTVRSVEWLRK